MAQRTSINIKKIVLERQCPKCGKTQELELTLEQYQAIQNAKLLNDETVPFLTSTQREFFLSGMCGHCWDELFKLLGGD